MDRAAAVGLVGMIEATSEPVLLERLVSLTHVLSDSQHCLGLLLGSDGRPTHRALVGAGAEEVGRPVPPEVDGDARRPALVVPMRVDGDLLGTLHLARTAGAPAYRGEDETVVDLLAGTAALLVRRMRRLTAAEHLVARMRQPRSVDLGLDTSQLPDLVTVRRLLATTADVLQADATYVSRLRDGSEELVHVHSRTPDPLLPEGLVLADTASFGRLTVEERIAPSVPDVTASRRTAAVRTASGLDVGCYAGAPVRLPDGTVFGVLAAVAREAGEPLTSSQLYSLRAIADLIGVELAAIDDHAVLLARERDIYLDRLASVDRRVHLQPILDLATGRPAGYEALARFVDPSGTFRRPDLELEEAHRHGLGVRLEHDLLRLALETLPRVPTGQYLSINLSPNALVAPTAFELLSLALVEHPGRLVLELTEHEHIDDYEPVLEALGRLRELGLRLAVDDTGAGYASLQHVTALGPDILKLDAAFGHDVDRNPAHRAAARAIIGFAEELGAELVAEGIETEEELDVLRQLGATHGQGYLLGRPAPVDEVLSTTEGLETQTPPAAR